jgi:hypothetical protein
MAPLSNAQALHFWNAIHSCALGRLLLSKYSMTRRQSLSGSKVCGAVCLTGVITASAGQHLTASEFTG